MLHYHIYTHTLTHSLSLSQLLRHLALGYRFCNTTLQMTAQTAPVRLTPRYPILTLPTAHCPLPTRLVE